MDKLAAKNGTALRRATAALTMALAKAKPELKLSSLGYVEHITDNLLAGVMLDDFEADLRSGDGNELDNKFRAAYSSAALAVNNFAPFKRAPDITKALNMAGTGAFRFEGKCHTGVIARGQPNLDLLAQADYAVVGIESKCTEHMRRHTAKFSPAYEEQIRDERRDGPWFKEMMRLCDDPDHYTWLDAAQLIKHAFGLAKTFRNRSVNLVYLFWEPINSAEFAGLAKHRQEVAEFSSRMQGGFPEFSAVSYAELWQSWDDVEVDWLPGHLKRVRERYELAI